LTVPLLYSSNLLEEESNGTIATFVFVFENLPSVEFYSGAVVFG